MRNILIDTKRYEIHKSFEAAFALPKSADRTKRINKIVKESADFISKHRVYYREIRNNFWKHLEEVSHETA